MEVKKGQNMIEHETEIYSRPARTWFQTSKEKEAAESKSKNSSTIIVSVLIYSSRHKQATTRSRLKRCEAEGSRCNQGTCPAFSLFVGHIITEKIGSRNAINSLVFHVKLREEK